MVRKKFVGREVTEEWLAVNDLSVDPAYQRDEREHAIRRWVREFNPDAIGMLLVSRRASGQNVLLDGQQRREVVRRALGEDQKIPCHVYHGLTRAQEAELFLKFNDDIAVRPFDKFKARLAQGDPEAKAINTLVEASGLEITQSPHPKTFRAITALEQVFMKGGPEVLAAALDVTVRAGLADEGPPNGEVFTGLARFIARYPECNRAKLVRILQEVPENVFLARARIMKAQLGGWRLSQIVGQQLLTAYNKGLRANNLLPSWSDNDREAWKPAAHQELDPPTTREGATT